MTSYEEHIAAQHCNGSHSEWLGALHVDGYRVNKYLHAFKVSEFGRPRYHATTQRELNRQHRVRSHGLHLMEDKG